MLDKIEDIKNNKKQDIDTLAIIMKLKKDSIIKDLDFTYGIWPEDQGPLEDDQTKLANREPIEHLEIPPWLVLKPLVDDESDMSLFGGKQIKLADGSVVGGDDQTGGNKDGNLNKGDKNAKDGNKDGDKNNGGKNDNNKKKSTWPNDSGEGGGDGSLMKPADLDDLKLPVLYKLPVCPVPGPKLDEETDKYLFDSNGQPIKGGKDGLKDNDANNTDQNKKKKSGWPIDTGEGGGNDGALKKPRYAIDLAEPIEPTLLEVESTFPPSE